jgi:hypothetical protein
MKHKNKSYPFLKPAALGNAIKNPKPATVTKCFTTIPINLKI